MQDSGNGKHYLDYSCPYTCWHATCVSNTQYLFLGLLLESILIRKCWRHVAIWIDINHNHSSISSKQPVMRMVQHVSACHIPTLVIHFLYYVSLQICNNQQKRCDFHLWHEDSEYTSTFYAVWQSNKQRFTWEVLRSTQCCFNKCIKKEHERCTYSTWHMIFCNETPHTLVEGSQYFR